MESLIKQGQQAAIDLMHFLGDVIAEMNKDRSLDQWWPEVLEVNGYTYGSKQTGKQLTGKGVEFMDLQLMLKYLCYHNEVRRNGSLVCGNQDLFQKLLPLLSDGEKKAYTNKLRQAMGFRNDVMHTDSHKEKTYSKDKLNNHLQLCLDIMKPFVKLFPDHYRAMQRLKMRTSTSFLVQELADELLIPEADVLQACFAERLELEGYSRVVGISKESARILIHRRLFPVAATPAPVAVPAGAAAAPAIPAPAAPVLRLGRNRKTPLEPGQLEQLVAEYILIFDHTAFLADGGQFAQAVLGPLLKAAGRKILVDEGITEELNNLARLEFIQIENDETVPDPDPDPDLVLMKNNARKALKCLARLASQGVLEVLRGAAAEDGPSPTLPELAANLAEDRAFCLFTQDQGAALDCWELKRPNLAVLCVTGDAKARINRGARPKPAEGEASSVGAAAPSPAAPGEALPQESPVVEEQPPSPPEFSTAKPQTVENSAPASKKNSPPAFPESGEPIFDDHTPLPVDKLPGAGDTVRIAGSGETLWLREILSSGGEGSIYLTTRPAQVAKIFNRDKLTMLRKKKLELMVSQKLSIPGVCWPLELLENGGGEFVGYLMEQASGVELAKSVFRPRRLQSMPGWDRKRLAALSMRICEMLEELHRNNVVMGDVNGRNILVDSGGGELKVFFVDADSYQVGQFPCAVGTEIFTAPEIFREQKGEGKELNYAAFFRTKHNEYYALASLLFQIIMPGMPPFVNQGKATIEESIVNYRFTFPFESNKGENAPTGVWRSIWSHLTYRMKAAFHGVFTGEKRLNCAQWRNELRIYLSELEADHTTNELFPNTFKVTDATAFVNRRCRACEQPYNIAKEQADQAETNDYYALCPICRAAIRQSKAIQIEVECGNCHRTFSISQYHAARNLDQGRDQECPDCYKKRTQPAPKPKQQPKSAPAAYTPPKKKPAAAPKPQQPKPAPAAATVQASRPVKAASTPAPARSKPVQQPRARKQTKKSGMSSASKVLWFMVAVSILGFLPYLIGAVQRNGGLPSDGLGGLLSDIQAAITGEPEDGVDLDPFAPLEIRYQGFSPNARAVATNISTDPFLSTIEYSVKPGNSLNTGDKVVVTASLSRSRARDNGYRVPKDLTLELIVPNVDQYYTDYEAIAPEDREEIQGEALDYIESILSGKHLTSFLTKFTGEDNLEAKAAAVTFDEPELVRVYLSHAKPGIYVGFFESNSYIQLFYRITAHGLGEEPLVVYTAVKIPDIQRTEEGGISLRYQDISSSGEDSLDTLYRETVSPLKSDYIVTELIIEE